jgi:hypothetical protein
VVEPILRVGNQSAWNPYNPHFKTLGRHPTSARAESSFSTGMLVHVKCIIVSMQT